MAKKWEQMTKNQKLEILRAEVEKMVTAVGTLMRRLDDVERRKSKSKKPKPRAQKVLHNKASATPAASNTLNEHPSELPTSAPEPPTATGTEDTTTAASSAQ
jgi:hypothetical protein